MSRRLTLVVLPLALLCGVFSLTAHAAYPERPVRFIVPFASGGGSDFVARLLASKITQGLGQQVIIDNRPGAGGLLGTQMAARATGDGHTLLLIDTPGLRSAPEGALAAGLAGAAVLVIGPGKTDLMSLSASMARLEESGTEVLGVVINRAPLRRVRTPDDEAAGRMRADVAFNAPRRVTSHGAPSPVSRQVAFAVDEVG